MSYYPYATHLNGLMYDCVSACLWWYKHCAGTIQCVYPSVRDIVYVNPLVQKPTRIKAILNAWNAITKRHPNEGPQGTWKVTLRPHTRQQDGHSCGVLVMEVSAKRLTRHTAVCMHACVCFTYLRYFTSVFVLDMNSNLLTGTYKCNVHVCWVSEKQDLYKCFILRIYV